MILLLDIISNLLNLINGIFLYLIFRTFLPIRESKIIQIVALVCCWGIAKIIIWVNDTANIIGMLLMFLAIAFLLYKGKWIKKTSMVFIIYPMIIAVNFITYNIGESIVVTYYDNKYVETIFSTALYNITIAARIPIWYFTWRFCKKYIKDIVELLDTKMWLLIDCICITMFTAILIILNFLPDKTIIAYPICIASIITAIGCLYLTGYIAKSAQTSFRLSALELEERYYEDKFRDEQRVRSIYHDMKNHLLLLQSSECDITQANTMIESIKEQIEDYENYCHTGNDFLDVILRDKLRVAKKNAIDLNAVVHFEDGGFIEPLDISTLFGNAIDNAIEASLKLPSSERLITIKANRFRDMLSIVIENNVASDIDVHRRTDKPDKFLHGFGLENIERTVEKYLGQCSVKQEAGVFALKIIIPIP